MSKFTAIYVRRSVSDKDKGNNSLSIDAQREECIGYVGEEADYKVYCDDGKSGKDVYHRPEFMQMMSDAKEGLIDKIVVKKYDRFSRNMREYLKNWTGMVLALFHFLSRSTRKQKRAE